MCRNDPCVNAECPSSPLAVCKPSFCGSCHAEFYDDDDQKVNCYGKFHKIDIFFTLFRHGYQVSFPYVQSINHVLFFAQTNFCTNKNKEIIYKGMAWI